MNEYMIAFSSFYKAVYAQEKLQDNNMRATLKKTPPNLMKSCGYALYLKTNSIGHVLNLLGSHQIENRGVYRIDYTGGKPVYRMI